MPTLNRLNQLAQLTVDPLAFGRGIERETLRVDRQGRIAQTPHPKALGSALTHPSITTDYSEALLEFITGVHNTPAAALDELGLLHRYTAARLGDELLWPASMPAILPGETEIPIAQYGSSHIGRLKTVYRNGLWHRYGRTMQTIAGVHYNWSIPAHFWQAWADQCGWQGSLQAFINEEYFGLIRGFRRHSWLLLYLFGASPAVDKSFAQGGRTGHLETLDDQTLYLPYATTLRMSKMGYSNAAQDNLYVCFNSLQTYTETLAEAIHTSYAPYEALGVKVGDEYRQINANVLQIENEYYSDLRPKRVTHSGEKPLRALNDRGVEYIEVRCLDVDPYAPYGIDEDRMDFVDLFLFWCLVQDNDLVHRDECFKLRDNNQKVAAYGRDPSLTLDVRGEAVPLRDQGLKILDSMASIVQQTSLLPASADHYLALLEQHRQALLNPDLTLSARMLADIKAQGGFTTAELAQAHRHTTALAERGEERDRIKGLDRIAEQSLNEQNDMERQSLGDFDAFLAEYQSQ
ncbi:MAG: glutamate--cysteine ligase [Saccharospirillum sp.]